MAVEFLEDRIGIVRLKRADQIQLTVSPAPQSHRSRPPLRRVSARPYRLWQTGHPHLRQPCNFQCRGQCELLGSPTLSLTSHRHCGFPPATTQQGRRDGRPCATISRAIAPNNLAISRASPVTVVERTNVWSPCPSHTARRHRLPPDYRR